MIFNATKSVLSELTSKTTQLGQNLKTIRQTIQQVYNVGSSIGGKTKGISATLSYLNNGITKNDVQCIEAYNAEIADGVSAQTAWYHSMQSASVAAQNLVISANGSKVSVEALNASMKTAETTSKAFTIALNVGVMLAITLVTSAITHFINKQKEARQVALEMGDTAKSEAENITSLYKAYSEAKSAYDTNVGSKESLESATESLLSALGYEESAIDNLIEKYGSLDNAINQVTRDTLIEQREELTQGYEAAKEQLVADAKTGFWDALSGDYMYSLSLGYDDEAKMMAKVLEDAKIGYDGYGSNWNYETGSKIFSIIGNTDTAEGVQKMYEYLLRTRSALEAEIGNLYTREELAESTAYKNINSKINVLKDSYEELDDYVTKINSISAEVDIRDALADFTPKTQEELENCRTMVLM